MSQESRVKKTLLNARVNLIFYFLTLCLSFFSRKIFLDCLGADFVGLTGTLQNLLGFLNLAELGIGSAIGYLLYKPLFDHDQEKINEIISVMGYLYRWIGLIILGGGCILACFLPFIFPDSDTGFNLPLIYFAYFAFLGSSLIGYFINYRQNLLGADQKNYVVTAYFQSATIIKTLIQMILAYYTQNLYIWVLIEFLFGIIYSFILNWKINQTYPWLRAEISLGRRVFGKYPEVMRKTKQLFVHQINSFVQFQCTPFLSYIFVSLEVVAFVGNYTLIMDKVTGLMNTVLGSSSAGIGNLIAEGSKEKIISVFWEITVVRILIAGIMFIVSIINFENFITVWLGKQFVMSIIILALLLCRIYIQISIGCVGQFIYGYGLFRDVWSSIAQTVIFLLFACIGGYYHGLYGILMAGIISIFLIQGIWKPYFLYKYGFRISVLSYWRKWIGLNLINITGLIISYFIISKFPIIQQVSTVLDWSVATLYSLVISTIVLAVLFFVSNREMKKIASRIISKK